METRRVLSYLSVCLGSAMLFAAAVPNRAEAWLNIGTHGEINKLALELFAERQKSDSLLKDVSLGGEPCTGLALDPADGEKLTNIAEKIGPIESIVRKKSLADWIIDGGYSADMPHGPMALRHFYDPTDAATPYLADLDWLNGFLRMTIGSLAENPQIDAVEWATQKDLGMGPFPQEYSYAFAKDYFKAALADTSRDTQNYGKAWRALGETMHLVADMALVPHVRNDGHGMNDGDPVEASTTGAKIRQNNSIYSTSAINYNQNVSGLMHALAAYTNKNFFSKDTIPVPERAYTANGRPAYPSPDISQLTVNKGGYLVSTIDGQTVRQARQSAWYRWGLSSAPAYMIDGAVVSDQVAILAPTIVRTTEAVIEKFLPRFAVQATMMKDSTQPGKFFVTGRITQTLNTEWQERLIIRNGVYVSINGVKETVKLYDNADLNEFSHTISAGTGDNVMVIYDLGGYVIQAPPVLKVESCKFNYTTNKVSLPNVQFRGCTKDGTIGNEIISQSLLMDVVFNEYGTLRDSKGSVTGTWKCNSVTLNFDITLTGGIDEGCWGSVPVDIHYVGSSTQTVSDGVSTYSGGGNVLKQVYTYDRFNCPTIGNKTYTCVSSTPFVVK